MIIKLSYEREKNREVYIEFLANGPFNLSGFEWTVGQELLLHAISSAQHAT